VSTREAHEYEFWGVRSCPPLDRPVDATVLAIGDDSIDHLRGLARAVIDEHGLDRCAVYRLAPDRRHVLTVHSTSRVAAQEHQR